LELILNRKCKDDYSNSNQDDEDELGEIDEGEERSEEDAAKESDSMFIVNDMTVESQSNLRLYSSGDDN
jgi:hypothetical protein